MTLTDRTRAFVIMFLSAAFTISIFLNIVFISLSMKQGAWIKQYSEDIDKRTQLILCDSVYTPWHGSTVAINNAGRYYYSCVRIDTATVKPDIVIIRTTPKEDK